MERTDHKKEPKKGLICTPRKKKRDLKAYKKMVQ
jgi:hypothetical protein